MITKLQWQQPHRKMKEQEEDEYNKMIRTLKERYAEEKPKFVKQELQDEFGKKKVVYKNFNIYQRW